MSLLIMAFFSSADKEATKAHESVPFCKSGTGSADEDLNADGGSQLGVCFFGLSSGSSSANAAAFLRTTGSAMEDRADTKIRTAENWNITQGPSELNNTNHPT